MRTRTIMAAVSVAALAVVGLSACSDTSSQPAPSASPSVSAAATTGSATEIAFAQGMIPHHQQAIEMADLALDPRADASPQVKALAEQIKGAQDPEIEQMTQWLQQWGAPSAMPGASEDIGGMDHGGHDMGGMTMSGMMTTEQMQQLQQVTGTAFDTMWLQMMVEHHEGAIAMAEQVKAGSTNPEVTSLADAIITGQRTEINTMRGYLDQ
ncbi:MAG: DUF305 domain-containing protein [Candidatus Nanopelagicales bacterium]|jgi:uncharacterized protein (DUF305 family)|nr:DUF305 domain-containing protein [Candidatus Nanopelagicales bacterium]